jgi:hypothetical protein
MQLVAPDILAEIARLSVGAVGLGFLLGLLLWTTGWMKRTFWFALTVTIAFGLYGLSLGRASGTHPLVTGLLLGLSAGVLSLELGRLIAFVTGGLAVALAVQTFVPSFPEPLLAYLVGGLVCVVLFKIWTLAVFGFVGTLLLTYCGLILAARFFKIDAFTLAKTKAPLLNALVTIGTAAGMVMQSRFERHLATRGDRHKAKAMELFNEKERAALEGAKGRAAKPRLFGLLKSKRVA